MATQRRETRDKYVRINSTMHQELRLICFQNGLSLQNLVTRLLRIVMEDKDRFAEVVADLVSEQETK